MDSVLSRWSRTRSADSVFGLGLGYYVPMPAKRSVNDNPAPEPEVIASMSGIADLVARYDVVLLDAYGVLVNSAGLMPNARTLVDAITGQGRGFFVVTNDASRLPQTLTARVQRFGLPIPAEAFITTGSLLPGYFADNALVGARCMVLGPADSESYVRAAGGQVVPVEAGQDCDAVVVCDEAGFSFLDTLDNVLSALYRHFDRGDQVALIQPNPDLIYPKGNNAYGFTSGAITLILEAALARRYPGRDLLFARLGKPHRPIFDQARRLAGTDSLLMIGDQLETDIAGARAAGIDAALVTTGVSRWDPSLHNDSPSPGRPTHVIRF